MSNRPFLVMLIVVLVLLGIALSLIDAVYGAPAAGLPPVDEPTIPVEVRSVDTSAVWLPFVACAECSATPTPPPILITPVPPTATATGTPTATATATEESTPFLVTPTVTP